MPKESTSKIVHQKAWDMVWTQAAAAAAKGKETIPMDTTMMNVFKGMVKKMNDGGGITFVIDLQTHEDDDALATTTLKRRDNEEGNGDEDEDEEWASESATSSSYMEAKYVYKIICAILFMIYFIQDLKQCILYKFYRFWQLKNIFFI